MRWTGVVAAMALWAGSCPVTALAQPVLFDDFDEGPHRHHDRRHEASRRWVGGPDVLPARIRPRLPHLLTATASASPAALDRFEQQLVVIGVWALLLVLEPWWLARYRFGPVEWLWRSLQPMRRGLRRNGSAPPVDVLGKACTENEDQFIFLLTPCWWFAAAATGHGRRRYGQIAGRAGREENGR